jgi:hypothetical protein
MCISPRSAFCVCLVGVESIDPKDRSGWRWPECMSCPDDHNCMRRGGVYSSVVTCRVAGQRIGICFSCGAIEIDIFFHVVFSQSVRVS